MFFSEVYALSNGTVLYLFAELKPESIRRASEYGVIDITVSGRTYPAVVLPTHSRDQLARISENLRTIRGLDRVAGMKELKALLHRDVIDPLLNPEKFRKFKLSIPNGLLLYGPPGCGKTFIVRSLAEELGY